MGDEYVIVIEPHQFPKKKKLTNGEDTWQQELNFGHPQYIENIVVIQLPRKDFISLLTVVFHLSLFLFPLNTLLPNHDCKHFISTIYYLLHVICK